ncbi:MAG: DnaJ domain-containing protein [Cyanobacteria bacterium J06634_6]
MTLAHHYRTLGLRPGASFGDVKAAYRRLVRKCHPDVNPDQAAVDRFIQINAAYTAISETLQVASASDTQTAGHSSHQSPTTVANQPVERLNIKELKLKLEKLGIGNFSQANRSQDASQTDASQRPSKEQQQPNAGPENTATEQSTPLSKQDVSLKQDAYNQLRDLLKQQKFPRAIALVEGLGHRLPNDSEINQWQAIVYQRWGRQLISQGQFQKARLYLKKALQTDPNNPSLIHEVDRDMGLLKHIQSAEATL